MTTNPDISGVWTQNNNFAAYVERPNNNSLIVHQLGLGGSQTLDSLGSFKTPTQISISFPNATKTGTVSGSGTMITWNDNNIWNKASYFTPGSVTGPWKDNTLGLLNNVAQIRNYPMFTNHQTAEPPN